MKEMYIIPPQENDDELNLRVYKIRLYHRLSRLEDEYRTFAFKLNRSLLQKAKNLLYARLCIAIQHLGVWLVE
jgi:hypothetical protein